MSIAKFNKAQLITLCTERGAEIEALRASLSAARHDAEIARSAPAKALTTVSVRPVSTFVRRPAAPLPDDMVQARAMAMATGRTVLVGA